MDGEHVSLVIAALALVVSIVGTVLANRRARASERLAIEARDDARAARTDALWSAHIESVHGVLALDPAAQSVAEPLRRLRVTGGALVDGLLDWPGLDRWIGADMPSAARCCGSRWSGRSRATPRTNVSPP